VTEAATATRRMLTFCTRWRFPIIPRVPWPPRIRWLAGRPTPCGLETTAPTAAR
jgi:hypothetical protein